MTNQKKKKKNPTNLSNLKIKVDKLDFDQLVPVPVHLSKLSDVVKNDVVTKDVYNPEKKNVEDKITDFLNLVIKTTLNAKINQVKGEILSITNLISTTSLTAIKSKIPNVSNWVKKNDYNTKFSESGKKITDHDHGKYTTTPEFNKLTSESFAVRLAQNWYC